MDGPGVSLFQGGESIRLNNSNQREEEEFLEEEKIRKAELQNLIDNAFSDLDGDDDDEDDSSISSSRCSRPFQSEYEQNAERILSVRSYSNEYSNGLIYSREQEDPVKDAYCDSSRAVLQQRGNGYEDFSANNHTSAHRNHCYHANSNVPPHQTDQTALYKQTDFNGTDQIKVLYEVRLREIDRLTKELDAEKEEKEQVIRKLTVCEHDKRNLETSLNATKTLLAESKSKISDLEKEISRLQDSIKEMEISKDEIRRELEITKTQLYHEQQKYHALERSDLNAKREKQMDLVIDSLKSQHKSEINELQEQYNAALDRINRKEDDYKTLEKKLEELEKKHTEGLLNKCDSALRQEATVKAMLDEANKEKLELMKRISSLEHECNMLKNDIDQYESFPKLRLQDNSSSDDKDTDSFILLSSGWRPESKKKEMSLPHTDLVNKLKEELHRALMGQRTKRKEIMRLQEQVQSKELQISKMKEQERMYLSQTEVLKADMNRVLQQAEKARNRTKENELSQLLAKLQADLTEVEKDCSIKTERIADLEKEIANLKEQLSSAEGKYKNISDQYFEYREKEVQKLRKESETLLKDKELEWGREMEKLMTECDEVKSLYLEIKKKKDEIANRVTELEKANEELKKEKLQLQQQLSKKQEDIKQLEDHILLIGKDNSSESLLKEVKKDLNGMIEKQNMEISILKSKLQEAAKSDEELIQLKGEITKSKMRYIELEKTLKEEFQTDMIKLKDENTTLKDLLKKKEAEISLRKMCVTNQKKDICIGTDDVFLTDTINHQNLSEINRLEKEVDRLKELHEMKCQEILKLTASHEQRLFEELQEMEKKMLVQHQKEITLAENKVKELSLKYFSEEIEKLQAQYSKDLQAVKDEEQARFNELKISLAKKQEELKVLYARKEQLESILSRYEEERKNAALIMAQWAKEVGEISDEKEKLVAEMEELKKNNLEISNSMEEIKVKLKETRKAALVYKRRIHEVKSSLTEKYKNLIAVIQKRVDEAVSAREIEIKEKLDDIEFEYKSRENPVRLEPQVKDIT